MDACAGMHGLAQCSSYFLFLNLKNIFLLLLFLARNFALQMTRPLLYVLGLLPTKLFTTDKYQNRNLYYLVEAKLFQM